MAWFKVDDGFFTSQKVLMIPRATRNEVVGSWLMVGTWSAHKMTDGIVPRYVLDEFNVSNETIEKLIEVGLWLESEAGIVFHDWAEYQPTRQQLQEKSRTRSEVGSLGGRRSGEARRSKAEANAKQNEANTNPVPEPEPVPVLTSNEVNNYVLFEKFWDAWPRKESKKKAEDSFLKAAKKTDPALIVATAQAYAASPYRPDKQFVPHATTWLNQERWNDPLPEAPAGVVRQSAAQKNLSTVAYFAELERSSQNLELEGAAPWEL